MMLRCSIGTTELDCCVTSRALDDLNLLSATVHGFISLTSMCLCLWLHVCLCLCVRARAEDVKIPCLCGAALCRKFLN